jgi:hypothetical protein
MLNSKQIWRIVPLILIGVIILTQTTSVMATPVLFTWGTFDDSGSTAFGVYEADDVTVLQTGDLAQLIWTGPDGMIDPPNPDGTTTGDDLILDMGRVENGGALPPPARDKGYIPFEDYTFDTEDPYSGGNIYIRAWNAFEIANATAYGNSTVGTLTADATYSAPRWRMTHTPTAITLSAFSASSHANSPWVLTLGFGLLAVMIAAVIILRRRSKIVA